MGRFNINKIYEGRLEEIDKQIKSAVYKKQWGLIKKLRSEKKHIEESLEVKR